MADPAPTWTDGAVAGVTVRQVARYSDHRGWLAELFRSDDTPADILPTMCYVSVTLAGQARGPHEHRDQTDMFGMVGPGDFRLTLWDNRPGSPTRGNRFSVVAGESAPAVVIIPPGVIHAYRNVASREAWVLNFPNRLYRGQGRREAVDEIRYEDRPDMGLTIDP